MSSSAAVTQRPADGDTPSRILDAAELLVQTRGFNDMSYADIAAQLAISKPSLHYHFPTKALLGEAVIARYSSRFYAELALIDAQETELGAKLARYAGLYRNTVAAGRMCLCGILAAEFHTLPIGMQSAVLEFFDRNETWLVDVMSARDVSAPSEEMRGTARGIINGLEGSAMLARAYDDASRFDAGAAHVLAGIERQ